MAAVAAHAAYTPSLEIAAPRVLRSRGIHPVPGDKKTPPVTGGVSTETCDAGAVYAGVTFAADGPFGPCVNSNFTF